MRYSVPLKFLAVLLAALSLTTAFLSILGIAQVAELGLYAEGMDGWMHNRLEKDARELAEKLAERDIVWELTNGSVEELKELGYRYDIRESLFWTDWEEHSYNYTITDGDGNVISENRGMKEGKQGFFYQAEFSVEYPVIVLDNQKIDEEFGTDYIRREIKAFDCYDGKSVPVRYSESPKYQVSVNMEPNDVMSKSGSALALLQMVYSQRYNLMILLAVSLLLFAVAVVYLCCAAGKEKTGDRSAPGGLNRLPLDLYLLAGGGASAGIGALAAEMIRYWFYTVDNFNAGTLSLVCLVLLTIALIIVGFIYALSAQMKAEGAYWWYHSLLGKAWPWLWQCICTVGRGIWDLIRLLPAVWQFLVVGVGCGTFLVLGALYWDYTGIYWPFLVLAAICLVVLLYSGYAIGAIMHGAKKMASGRLDSRIDTRFLIGSYGRCARHLNELSDVATVAAQKQLKSERMRTELITNVSHDIKTPLTSIINYVDLLQRAENEESAEQYLEVLGRQSQRLKKLIDDLMEMSKVSSGNISADIIPLNPVEATKQALGEFSDKLDSKGLTVGFEAPQQEMTVLADGRLMWRVLSNLLSNVVKYAMPDTRVYVQVTELESQVLISIKNISREPLNISSEELMERFVRGDASRNTEGSGLGLNIAKSLMELQKGQMKLLADGDLFKATPVFPKSN